MAKGSLFGILAGIILGTTLLTSNAHSSDYPKMLGKVPYSTVDSVYTHLVKKYKLPKRDYFILVYGRAQKEYIFRKTGNDFEILKSYNVSTGLNGFGNKSRSGKTSLGSFMINEKYGDNAPIGTVFEYLINTGRIAKIEKSHKKTKKRLLLTRVITLKGLDSQNKNMLSRCIYIHGTNEEGLIGEQASEGCVGMINIDMIDFYDSIRPGDLGEIVE